MQFAIISRCIGEASSIEWMQRRDVASERVLAYSEDANCEWAVSYRTNKRGDLIRTGSFVRKGFNDPMKG